MPLKNHLNLPTDDQTHETNDVTSPGPKIKKKKNKLKKDQSSNPNRISSSLSANNTNTNNAESDNASDNNNDSSIGSSHPRNRWRCMQPRLCNYCWKTFSNSFNLKQHIVNVHIQSQGVTCTLCEKVVKNKWYLRKHLVTAHGAPLKRVTGNKNKENGGGSFEEHSPVGSSPTSTSGTENPPPPPLPLPPLPLPEKLTL